MLLKNRGSSSKPSVKSREEQLYDKIQELSLDVNTRIREVRVDVFSTDRRRFRIFSFFFFTNRYWCVSLSVCVCDVDKYIHTHIYFDLSLSLLYTRKRPFETVSTDDDVFEFFEFFLQIVVGV